jgi:hypothetical protein
MEMDFCYQPFSGSFGSNTPSRFLLATLQNLRSETERVQIVNFKTYFFFKLLGPCLLYKWRWSIQYVLVFVSLLFVVPSLCYSSSCFSLLLHLCYLFVSLSLLCLFELINKTKEKLACTILVSLPCPSWWVNTCFLRNLTLVSLPFHNLKQTCFKQFRNVYY